MENQLYTGSASSAHIVVKMTSINTRLDYLRACIIHEDRILDESDEANGNVNLYNFNATARRLTIYSRQGAPLADLEPFAHAKCMYMGKWVITIRFVVFLTGIPEFTIFPYMRKYDSSIDIISLDPAPKKIIDLRGKVLYVIEGVNAEVRLYNSGTADEPAWNVHAMPTPIGHGYEDRASAEDVRRATERTPGITPFTNNQDTMADMFKTMGNEF